MQVLIATRNAGKAREFRQMLADDGFDWPDLSAFPHTQEVEETGRTFRANASLKASGYARQTGMWALADDSGLEVDALDGRPGVASARWAELNRAGKGDIDNNALLLRQMSDVADDRRSARFVCVLALADPAGRIVLTAREILEGHLLRQGRGDNGFGYDPLFYVPSLGRTTAELPPQRKHEISHRGKALRLLRELISISGLAEWAGVCLPQGKIGAS